MSAIEMILAAHTIIEFGQMALPGNIPDIMDRLLEVAGWHYWILWSYFLAEKSVLE